MSDNGVPAYVYYCTKIVQTMTQKKLHMWYWIITILFGGFMIFSSISNVFPNEQTISFFASIQYPAYIIPFLGVAKIIGTIVILTPALDRFKEWAYAGLCFDLVGALYSLIAVFGLHISNLILVALIGALFTSYFLWKKKKAMNS
ncbi:MAG: hypothetical protein RLZZ262_1798 [Bacteroidota bacterium]|jgi:hypothetical protein